MNLVYAQSTKFGKLMSCPQLICSSEEFAEVNKRFDAMERAIGNNLDFFKELGLYDEAYKLYDKMADIAIIDAEDGEDDMSKAMPVVL